jgi:hypothetical protein
MEPVVQVLRRRDRLSRAVEKKNYFSVWTDVLLSSVDTHNPILAPTDSAKPQACCLAFSSCDVDNFPRCFSESLTTS